MTQLVSLFPDVPHAVENTTLLLSNFLQAKESHVLTICDIQGESIYDHFSVYRYNALKTNKATGSDNISLILLKIVAQFISTPLAHIFNPALEVSQPYGSWQILFLYLRPLL